MVGRVHRPVPSFPSSMRTRTTISPRKFGWLTGARRASIFHLSFLSICVTVSQVSFLGLFFFMYIS